MKTLHHFCLYVLLCLFASLFVASVFLNEARAADARVITETGATGSTNILAIGIDQRSYSVIRFYLEDNKTLEIRADSLTHMDRPILRPPLSPALTQERAAIIARLATQTNAVDFSAVTAPLIVSNLVRLQQIDERLAR